MSGTVNWFGDEIKLKLKDATDRMIQEAANLVKGQAQINASDNQQVDTGFMRESIYVSSKQGGEGGASSGTYYSKKEGRQVKRNALPKMPAPEGGAIVGVGAEYGIYQEMEKPFLYPALDRVAGTMEAQIVAEGAKGLE